MGGNIMMNYQSVQKQGDELELCLHKLGNELELFLMLGKKKKTNQYAKGLSMLCY